EKVDRGSEGRVGSAEDGAAVGVGVFHLDDAGGAAINDLAGNRPSSLEVTAGDNVEGERVAIEDDVAGGDAGAGRGGVGERQVVMQRDTAGPAGRLRGIGQDQRAAASAAGGNDDRVGNHQVAVSSGESSLSGARQIGRAHV